VRGLSSFLCATHTCGRYYTAVCPRTRTLDASAWFWPSPVISFRRPWFSTSLACWVRAPLATQRCAPYIAIPLLPAVAQPVYHKTPLQPPACRVPSRVRYAWCEEHLLTLCSCRAVVPPAKPRGNNCPYRLIYGASNSGKTPDLVGVISCLTAFPFHSRACTLNDRLTRPTTAANP